MSSLKEIWRRIGMRDAISWPVFWLSLIAGALANYATSSLPAPISVRLLILAVGQIGLWVPPLLARRFLLQDPDRSRPVVVLLAFTVGILARAVLVGALSGILIAPAEVLWFRRFIGALLNIGWVVLLTGYVTTSIRERRRQIARLRQEKDELEFAVRRTSAFVGERNQAAVSRIQETLLQELQALDRDNPQASLAVLQHTASAVVRPLSHELANAFPALDRSAVAVAPVTAAWSEVLDSVAMRSPFRPWATALTLALPLIASAAVQPSLGAWFLSLFFVVAGILWLMNVVLTPVLHGRSRETRLSLVVAGALVAGLAASAIGFLLLAIVPALAGITGDMPAYVFGFLVGLTCYTAIFGMGVAVATAFSRDRARVARELLEASQNLERSLVLMRQTQWLQQKALSRALHGPVQTAVTAAAIRLEDSLRHGRGASADIDEVRRQLTAELEVLALHDGAVVSLSEVVRRIAATWEGICAITLATDQEVDPIVDTQPALRGCIIDIVSEAVTNAIRHSGATFAAVTVKLGDSDHRTLRVEVETNGPYLGEGSSRGLGSRLLDECTIAWSRRPSAGGQILEADFPIAEATRTDVSSSR